MAVATVPESLARCRLREAACAVKGGPVARSVLRNRYAENSGSFVYSILLALFKGFSGEVDPDQTHSRNRDVFWLRSVVHQPQAAPPPLAKTREGPTSFTHSIALPTPLARSIAIATLMGATMLATPLSAARADTPDNAAIQLAQATPSPKSAAGAAATETKGETVEQRITELHAALKITPDQEAKWKDVAQDMRENAAAMDKLIAETRTTPPQNMTAVDDLKTYQKLSQAHVDGLKNLITSFTTLYDTMPDAQKKVADKVFDASERPADTTAPGKQG
jgi:hypothetical protein